MLVYIFLTIGRYVYASYTMFSSRLLIDMFMHLILSFVFFLLVVTITVFPIGFWSFYNKIFMFGVGNWYNEFFYFDLKLFLHVCVSHFEILELLRFILHLKLETIFLVIRCGNNISDFEVWLSDVDFRKPHWNKRSRVLKFEGHLLSISMAEVYWCKIISLIHSAAKQSTWYLLCIKDNKLQIWKRLVINLIAFLCFAKIAIYKYIKTIKNIIIMVSLSNN